MTSAEHVVEDWMDHAHVLSLSQEQIALLVEAVDQYGEHCAGLIRAQQARQASAEVRR
jgi:uncharacterized protein (DUF1778 family)